MSVPEFAADFAHLAVTLCRCLNIPALYVNGHLGDIGVPVVDPMDFSAWIEAYLGGSWWTFRSSHNMPRIGQNCSVAPGRDAVYIPRINSFGPEVLIQSFGSGRSNCALKNFVLSKGAGR